MKKDIEWLKKKFDEVVEFRKESNPSSSWGMGSNTVLKHIKEDFKNLISQLDVPEVNQLDKKIKELDSYNDELIRDNNQLRNELNNKEVLSQEFIDEHKYNHYIGKPFVYVDDLQNLLVTKQDKPIIPQFVANFIRATKPNNSLRLAFEYIAQQKIDNYDDELALWVEEGNSELFARAWIYGYEVEKEKLYYITDQTNNWTLMTFELSDVVGEEIIEFVYGYSENETIHFNSKEKAELIAHFVGESSEVEEVTK